MFRSEINKYMAEAIDLLGRFKITLPPFAYWSVDDFQEKFKKDNVGSIVERGLGWDITDYGLGNFHKTGLFLFTLRNGLLSDLNAGRGMVYAEKLLISRSDQLSPMHTHVIKTEDIINRGGATLAVQLFGSKPDGSFDECVGGQVFCDGVARKFGPGDVISLEPGESVTLQPGDWHAFWGQGGDVLIGEVSTVNDDVTDNIFKEPIGRFSEVVEDEMPKHLLVSDYETWLSADKIL